MKRAAALIMSLMILLAQWTASAQTLSTEGAKAAASCGCCQGKRVCCCVEEATPITTPLAATPVTMTGTIDFNAIALRCVAWLLPPPPATALITSDSVLVSSLAVPLFQRNCALLI